MTMRHGRPDIDASPRFPMLMCLDGVLAADLRAFLAAQPADAPVDRAMLERWPL